MNQELNKFETNDAEKFLNFCESSFKEGLWNMNKIFLCFHKSKNQKNFDLS